MNDLRKVLSEDWKPMLLVFALVLACLIFLYRKANILTVFLLVLNLFWISLVPGYALIALFADLKKTEERIILSFILGFAVTGILMYYANWLLNVSIARLTVFLPPAIVLAAVIARKAIGSSSKKSSE